MSIKFYNIYSLGQCYKQCMSLEEIVYKLELAGQDLGRVFNFRQVCVYNMHLLQSNKTAYFKLETQPKLLLGSLPLAFTLPVEVEKTALFSAMKQV